MATKEPLAVRVSRPLFWVVVVAFILAWVALKGGASVSPFAQQELAPGVFGLRSTPSSDLVHRAVLLMWPGAEGWNTDWSDRVASLNAAGAVVIYLDYYQGGRDSFHGAPNEWNADLWGRWKSNLSRDLEWAFLQDRDLPWGLLLLPGRGEELLKALGQQVPPLPLVDSTRSAALLVDDVVAKAQRPR